MSFAVVAQVNLGGGEAPDGWVSAAREIASNQRPPPSIFSHVTARSTSRSSSGDHLAGSRDPR
jgi:hypothetical protein